MVWNASRCQPFCESGRIGSSFMQGIVTNLRTYTLSATDSGAKFWLDPVRLQNSNGFGRREIARIRMLVNEHQKELIEA